MLSVALLLFAWVGQVLAGPSRLVVRATPPSQDPFYTPPSGFGSFAPGTVLNHRQVTIAFEGIEPLTGYTAYQLLYRTTSANTTTPIAAVTTVIKPNNARPNQLLSFSTAEDSDNSICEPSYEYQEGSSQEDGISGFEEFFLIAFLNEGYTISAPDYEGENSAFAAGRLEGHAVLDGLRAALNYEPLGFNKSTAKVGGYGYSGGSISNTWAASLQPTYASELNVVGWASGGTPANLTGTVEYINGGLFAGFAIGGVGGLLQAYSVLDTLIDRIATPVGKAAINAVLNQCAVADIIEFAFQNFLSDVYQTEGDRLLYDPTVQSVLVQNVMGIHQNLTPTAPTFLYHAQLDEIIPISDVDTLVDRWCGYGIKSLIYTIDEGPAEHASAEVLFFPSALNFINDRFNGVAPVSGCVRNTTLLPELNPADAATGLQVILGDLLTVLTTKVGLDDSILKAALTAKAAAAGHTPGAGPPVGGGTVVSSVAKAATQTAHTISTAVTLKLPTRSL